MLLCRTHHRLVHEGGWSISLTQQGQVEVRRPDGTLLTEPPAPSGSAETLAGQHRTLGITPETSVPLWAGEVLDLDLAIDVLLHQEGVLG